MSKVTAPLPALVLAAGKSTRIASVTGGRPKPLLLVEGKSVIVRNLEWLASEGLQSVWVNLHHRPDEIRSELGDGARLGLDIHYSHEDSLLGTAGAWKHLREHWKGTTLVIYGDNLMRFELQQLIAHHVSAHAAATIAVFDPEVHPNTGIAGGRVLVSNGDRIAAFREGGTTAPTSGYVNAGAYVLEPELLSAIGDGVQDFGRDVFPRLASEGRLCAHVIEPSGYCLGLDTPESLAVAHRLIRTRQVSLA